MPTEMQDVAVFSPQGLLFPFLHHHTFSPRGMPDRPSLAHRTTLILFYDPPGSLVFPHQEGHPCWSKCARRTRSFSGRAFREHRTNMDVLPSFHRARSASKKNGLPTPSHHSETARHASAGDSAILRPRISSRSDGHLDSRDSLHIGAKIAQPWGDQSKRPALRFRQRCSIKLIDQHPECLGLLQRETG